MNQTMSMVISVYNHKGGSGKTTTTINVGKALNQMGNKVLLVDLDPQANLTYSLGVELNHVNSAIDISSAEVITTKEGVNVIPNITSPQFLSGYNFSHEEYLRDQLGDYFDTYDYVLLDCPPSVDMIVVNSIIASEGVIIPVLLDALSLEALRQVVTAIENLIIKQNKQLQFISVLPVMVDSRRHLTSEVLRYIKENFDVTLFENHIRMNVKVAEAPSYGKSVISYASKSNGALDYMNATNELLNHTTN